VRIVEAVSNGMALISVLSHACRVEMEDLGGVARRFWGKRLNPCWHSLMSSSIVYFRTWHLVDLSFIWFVQEPVTRDESHQR